MKISIGLLYLIVSISSTNIYNEQFKMLTKIKSFLQYNFYSDYSFKRYVKDIKTTVDLFKDTVTHADKDRVVQRYQFPNSIMKGFESAFMSNQGQVIEIINFVKPTVNSKGTSTYERLIGYATRIDNVVAFVVAKAYTQCGFVQQKERYRRRTCSGFWPFRSCRYVNDWRDRGYTAYELNQLSLALNTHNQVNIKKKIEGINPVEIIITGQSRLYSSSRRYSVGVKPNGFVAMYVNNIESGGFGKTFDQSQGPFSFRVKQSGDVVVQNDRGTIFWSANTANKGKFPFTMILTEDQNIVVIDSTNKPIWDKSYKYGHRSCIMIQGYKIVSENKQYYAEVRNGAIEVINKKDKKVVSRVGTTRGYGNMVAVLEKDGKLVIEANDRAIYTGNSLGGKSEYRFKVTNEGKLAIVNGAGQIVFTSN
jgi:hypothetical protein